jgi:hypothetical protein
VKTRREVLIAVLVVLAWVGVARLADADLRDRERTAVATRATT